MPLFTSEKEKQLWLYVFLIGLTIYSTLFFGQPLAKIFSDQNRQAILFLLGMLLAIATILIYGIQKPTSEQELVVWVGIATVYLLFFLRLGLPERSHLIEYSVLAIFIHKALMERWGDERQSIIATLAFTSTFLVGLLDEYLQIFLPNRVFDTEDILFNGLAALMAIVASIALNWVRRQAV